MPAMECKKVDEPSRSSFKKFGPLPTHKIRAGAVLSSRDPPGGFGSLLTTFY